MAEQSQDQQILDQLKAMNTHLKQIGDSLAERNDDLEEFRDTIQHLNRAMGCQ
ncbi:MAG: hypothetical protein ABJH63_12570 [Rhizobiaceae bacterium]